MSFFKKITDSVSKGVSSATEKAQQTVEITKLNSQISGKRKEIEKLFGAIGQSAYECYSVQEMADIEERIKPHCDQITAIHEEIALLDARIKALRNEKDCICGKRVSEDTRFCPSCGHPFPVVVEKTPIQVEAYVPEEEEDGAAEEGAPEAAEAVAEEAVRQDGRQVCQNCGTPLYADSHYCPACGQPTKKETQ
ncbi:zinc-ribbon domain-containing protein [Paenibacillaceae bacterium WGS1546]|uniref:zinc-ribbon domain-containing protein n=1 Tax=Cohnella sp. WGS1546 TaxID=3366810 RepID=UPI00372D6114